MMFTKLFTSLTALCFVAILIAGCGKDKFDTRPSLKIKSVSSYEVPRGGLFEIKLEYTDAEGDLSTADTALIVKKTVARCATGTLDFKYRLPIVPETKNSTGEIVLRFESGTTNFLAQGYGTFQLAPCPQASNNDTTMLRFFIRDKAGHISDTVSLERPLVLKRS